MLKIAKNEFINDSKIEAICTYGAMPLVRLASEAGKKNMVRRFQGRYGIKSLFIMDDGYVFLATYTPETYMSRIDKSLFFQIEGKKFYIRTDLVREICTRLSAGQRRDVQKAKENGMYFNLSGKKKVKYYMFTITGHVYGVQQIMNLNGPEQ